MTDTELFELCVEVYKRTGWGDWSQPDGDSDQTDAYWKHLKGETEAEAFVSSDHTRWSDAIWIAPSYDTDYIFGKLPHDKQFRLMVDTVTISKKRVYWVQGNWDKRWTEHCDDPLKALLKLVIALDDAKELLNV